MTFADYWAAKTAKNDGLLNVDTRMSMTVGEFCKQLRRAYEAGADGEYDQAPQVDLGSDKDGPEVTQLLETMFGKGFKDFNNKGGAR